MEDNVLDDGIAGATAQCLQSFTAIRAKYFDNSASLGRWGDQSTVRIDTERSEFSLMSLYHTIHTVFSHVVEDLNRAFSWIGQGDNLGNSFFIGSDSA